MAWGQAYKSHLGKLRKLQKRALRFIYFSERNQQYLGVIIDNNLSWKHHIDHVAIKINQTLGTAFSSMTYSLNHL